MASPTVGNVNYPTPDEVRGALLRSIKYGAAQRGLTVDVSIGSDHYIRMDAVAKRVSIAIANGKIARDEFSPLTATEENLEALAGIYGLTKRPAAAATGYVIITCNGTVTIPAGFQCTAPSGAKYQTTTAFTGGTLSQVQVRAVVGGESTDVDAGQKLTWDLASIGNLQRVSTVAPGGIDGGADADGDDELRRRLINKLSFPGFGGNVAHVVLWAEESSASVEAAYVYAAVRGPGSYDIAVTAEGGDRTLSASTLSTVASYVSGQMPGHADLNTTTVSPIGLDVGFALTIALPGSAGGNGGGWRNATPWPNSTSGDVKITAYNSSTGVATTDAVATNGLAIGTQIGVWDPVTDEDEPVMKEFVVDAVGLSGGFETITVQGGFGFDPTGAYISTGAVNLVAYAATTLEKFRQLGPGEKTDSADILPRGRRQPAADVSTETDVNSRIITAVQTEHPEIRSLDYSFRYATGTTSTTTTPPLPMTTSSPPSILVLEFLAFRKAA